MCRLPGPQENPEASFILEETKTAKQEVCSACWGHGQSGTCWGFVTRTEERGRKEGVVLHIREQFLVPRYHEFISLRQQWKQDVGFL